MEQMSDLKTENLKKGALPVNNDDIIDLIQTNMFAEIGCGPLCRVNPLTDRGKRFQLFKILCLTVIPILGVWGFTMYSLSDSVESKSDIEVAKSSMSIVVVLGRLIHRLQMERDMSVLYLSDLGPGTKTFLLAEYMATDDALGKLTIWPGALQSNPKEQFRSKVNLMSYIAQHRTSLNPKKVDLFEEINFYSDITSEFLEWLVENIKGSGFGSTWKTLVAYQKITRCKEDIGVERAYGAMFYTKGFFPRWTDFEFYNDQVHDFKYNYKTAVFYSDAVVPLLMEEVKEIQSTGINITVIVNAYRYEIQYHDLNTSYKSEEKTKWFFDNMTEYLDSLLVIQEKVANRITEEVEEVLNQETNKQFIDGECREMQLRGEWNFRLVNRFCDCEKGFITVSVNACRYEIEYHDLNTPYKSEEKTKWFFDNMTEYLDSLLVIQEKVANRITEEVEEVLNQETNKQFIDGECREMQLRGEWNFRLVNRFCDCEKGFITVSVNACRYEIEYHDLNTSYKSEEKTKWFFDNMTEYLDSLLVIQEKVANRITEEVEEVLNQYHDLNTSYKSEEKTKWFFDNMTEYLDSLLVIQEKVANRITEEVEEVLNQGFITVSVNACRYEIEYHDLNTSYKSEEKTKWFFDNMTEYLDSLLVIQEKVANRITEEVEEVLNQYHDLNTSYKSEEKTKRFFDNMTEYQDSLLVIQEKVANRITEEVEEVLNQGFSKVIVNAYRYEIQYHDLNTSHKSEEKTKWFFDNMTEYLDSLLVIQEKVANRITEEVEEVLNQVVTKVVIYASMVVVVIAMCPVIMFSSEALASDIQRYTQTLVEKTKELNLEKHKTDTLLYQMVPKSIAERLKNSNVVESEFFRSVTIFFSGISGFSRVCTECSPMDLVQILNSLYTSMDEQIELYDVYKVETINDCYMVASGLPNRNGEKHVSEIANMAIDILHMSRNKDFPCGPTSIQLQIGINTGSVSAGIVGSVMLRYCLFGNTVNIASRMKSYGLPNRIHISDDTYMCLRKTGKFKIKFRGNMDIKGKGRMDTYWLFDKVYGSTGSSKDENFPRDPAVYVNSDDRYMADHLHDQSNQSTNSSPSMRSCQNAELDEGDGNVGKRVEEKMKKKRENEEGKGDDARDVHV